MAVVTTCYPRIRRVAYAHATARSRCRAAAPHDCHNTKCAAVKPQPSCASSMTTTLSTLQLPLNTNCLASRLASETSWLAAGCYQLSACRTARHGGLHILAVAGSSEEGLKVTEVGSKTLPGEGLKACPLTRIT